MSNKTTPINMQDYLNLEIRRMADMGFHFPIDLVEMLNKRAKSLDKGIAADRTRRVYQGDTK